jgi:hypothetical protein
MIGGNMHSSDLNFTFPFQKIDKEQRIVTGIATADNVDLADDVVNFEASVEAFSNWVGNIREMHSPVAVGKLINWKQVPVNHEGQTYQGIEVSVYISKGAENTWQKILDGTLRGFSIGGMVQDKKTKFMEKIGRNINEIVRYTLGELSVVDNPCNPAGMFAMIKSVDGRLEYVAENLQDVFYCEDDKYASIGSDSACPACSEEMVIVGRTETFDSVQINKFISSYEEVMTKALSDINTVPTDAMAAEARRGLEWRREFNRGGTAVGVARARDIMNKDTLSISTVRRMHSFFSRHEVDKQGKGFTPGEGYPSAGRIAWALWGGDPGQTWARAITNRIKAMEKGVGTDVEGMSTESPSEMVSETAKAASSRGDFVSWNSSGGTARGKVVRVERDGQVNVPNSEFSVEGTEDDPALLIQIWKESADGWMATETYVGHKSSTVTSIPDLDKSLDTNQIGEGGGGIKNPEQGLNFDDDDMNMSKAATKREDGEDFPAAAFAYAPDPEMPSTWKLRLWDSLDEKETVAQVSRAVAALSPSGFRGNRVQIPAEDLASVKAKVRASWRQVNGSDRELPAILKRDNSNYLEDIIEKGGTDSMSLQENEIDDNVNTMSEDLTETQKQSILSKMGDFIFGKEESIEKAQTIEVNTANGNFKVVTDGSMTNPPQVVLNMVDVGAVEEKAGHMGMDEEMKSSDKDMVTKSEEAGTEEAAADAVEDSESVDSVDEGEEMDFEKVLEGLSNLLDEKLEKVKADITAEVDGKIDAIEKSVSEVKDSAEELTSDLEKVANSGAVKKSADVDADEDEVEVLEKSAETESFWGGIFVPTEIVKVLGYDS